MTHISIKNHAHRQSSEIPPNVECRGPHSMSVYNIVPPHLTRYMSRNELTEFLEEEYGNGIDFCIQVRED